MKKLFFACVIAILMSVALSATAFAAIVVPGGTITGTTTLDAVKPMFLADQGYAVVMQGAYTADHGGGSYLVHYVKLMQDIAARNGIHIAEYGNLVIDLNGHTISNASTGNLFTLAKIGNSDDDIALKIAGTGTITSNTGNTVSASGQYTVFTLNSATGTANTTIQNAGTTGGAVALAERAGAYLNSATLSMTNADNPNPALDYTFLSWADLKDINIDAKSAYGIRRTGDVSGYLKFLKSASPDLSVSGGVYSISCGLNDFSIEKGVALVCGDTLYANGFQGPLQTTTEVSVIPVYALTLPQSVTGGSVAAAPANPPAHIEPANSALSNMQKDDTVNVTFTPETGYIFASATVAGEEITFADLTNNAYSFAMPASDVSVENVVFEEITPRTIRVLGDASLFTATYDAGLGDMPLTDNASVPAGARVTLTIGANDLQTPKIDTEGDCCRYQYTPDGGDETRVNIPQAEYTFFMPDGETKLYLAYAAASENVHTVRFNGRAGSYASDTPQRPRFVRDGGKVSAPPNPVWTGEKFVQWSVFSSTGSLVAYDFNAPVLSDLTIYSTWVGASASIIRFDSAGGSTVDAIAQAPGTPVTAPDEPTRAGYTFAGWEPALPETMPETDLLCTAQWTANEYTITFDSDGGSEVDPITQDYETPITAPAAPTRTGYTFTGWEPALPETMPAKDSTCTAQWTINQYTITLGLGDGGTRGITQDYATPIETPEDPEFKGHTFLRWEPEIPATMPAYDMVIESVWTRNEYTITFDSDGGSEVDPITRPFDTWVEAPDEPIKLGYTFDGWDRSFPVDMPYVDIVVTAQWTPKEYLLTFDDGWSGSRSHLQAYNTPIGKPADPWRAYHTFAGWEPEIPETMPDRRVTYTAQWTPIPYTLTFEDGDGNVLSTITQAYAMPVTAPQDPTKEGYLFAGWDADIPEVMPGENRTITAQWTTVRVTIPPTATVLLGKAIPMTPAFEPADTPDKDYTWEFETDGIVEISDANNIRGVSPGTTRARAVLKNDNAVKSNWCAVTVKSIPTTIEILWGEEKTTVVGDYCSLQAKTDAPTRDIVWKSSSEKIAWIERDPFDAEYCYVWGVKPGTVTVTATVMNGGGEEIFDTYTVRVLPEAKAITVEGAGCVAKGATTQFQAILQPANADISRIRWYTLQKDIATVDSASGLVTGVEYGTTFVVANEPNHDADVAWPIQVVAPAETVRIESGDHTSDDIGERSALAKEIPAFRVGLKKTRTFTARASAAGVERTHVYQQFAWDSANKKIATVTQDGVVKGVKVGTTGITATTLDGSGIVARATVEVVPQITTITLSGPEYLLLTDATTKITAKFAPAKADKTRANWRSWKPEIATVDQSGNMTAHKTGAVEIELECIEDNVDASHTLYIVDATESVAFAEESGTVAVGGTRALQASAAPETAHQRFKWETKNKKIATVTQDGVVKGVKAGTTTIIARAKDDKTVFASYTVSVQSGVTGITLNKTSCTQVVGAAFELTATVLPKKGAGIERGVTWTSSNAKVVSVEGIGENGAIGKVTALRNGVSVITATTKEGGFQAECTVSIHEKFASKVVIDALDKPPIVGSPVTLVSHVLDENGGRDYMLQGVTWSIPNKKQQKLAKIDANGVFTGVKPGKVTVRATATNGSGATGECTLTVEAKATSVKLSKNTIVLYANGKDTKKLKQKTATLKATTGSKAAKNATVRWTYLSWDGALSVTADAKTGKTLTLAVNDAWWAKNPGNSYTSHTISAEAGEDAYAECIVEVVRLPMQIGIFDVTRKEQTLELAVGHSIDLSKAVVFDKYCGEDAIKWTIPKNYKAYATISAGGVLKAKKKQGTITVTAVPAYWGVDATDTTPATFTVKIVSELSTKSSWLGAQAADMPDALPAPDAVAEMPDAVDGLEMIVAE